MAFLSLEDSTKEQFMFLNCPGGGVMAWFCIYDMMQAVKPDINTLNIGLAASMGSFLLAGGTITKRMAFPHARVMMHQPSTSFLLDSESTRDFYMEIDELAQYRDELIQIDVQRTGMPFWVIIDDLERDAFMSATEAQAHGIIDLIAVSYLI